MANPGTTGGISLQGTLATTATAGSRGINIHVTPANLKPLGTAETIGHRRCRAQSAPATSHHPIDVRPMLGRASPDRERLAAMLAAMLADLPIEVERSPFRVDTSMRRQPTEITVQTAVLRHGRGAPLTDRTGLTRGLPENPLSPPPRWHRPRRIAPKGLRSTPSAHGLSRVTGRK